MQKQQVIWKPHEGKQTFALKKRVYELLYGGARGGGKTDAGLAWLLVDIDNAKYRGLVIRKNANDLSDWIDRARRMYIPLGAKFAGSPAVITFPSGAIIRTGHLKDENAYEKYQGHEYHRILIEELTHIPNEIDYLKLVSSCRSTNPDLKPRVFASTNPGGRGHAWVKKRFIDVCEPMETYTDPLTGRGRMFIPATIDDNPSLQNDPGYAAFLAGLPDPNLRDAWRYGKWDVFTGQFFGEWDEDAHVIDPFDIPADWFRFISFDYGFSKPSAVYWNAVDPITGKIYTYREIYVTQHTGEMLAQAIRAATLKDETIGWIVGDSSIANTGQESGVSVYGQMQQVFEDEKWDIPFRLTRKGPNSRKNGWNLMRGYLKVKRDERGNKITRWQIFKTCVNLIRTMPLQMYDDTNVDDLDTDLEDHAQDGMRYGMQAHHEPFEKRQPEPRKPGIKRAMNAEQLYQKMQDEYGDLDYIQNQ